MSLLVFCVINLYAEIHLFQYVKRKQKVFDDEIISCGTLFQLLFFLDWLKNICVSY